MTKFDPIAITPIDEFPASSRAIARAKVAAKALDPEKEALIARIRAKYATAQAKARADR
jgi:hypothetical protein